jgi:hypothetical protein
MEISRLSSEESAGLPESAGSDSTFHNLAALSSAGNRCPMCQVTNAALNPDTEVKEGIVWR